MLLAEDHEEIAAPFRDGVRWQWRQGRRSAPAPDEDVQGGRFTNIWLSDLWISIANGSRRGQIEAKVLALEGRFLNPGRSAWTNLKLTESHYRVSASDRDACSS
jgi:hypothetical protein